MRIVERSARVSAVLLLLAATAIAVGGCPKHENFPQPLSVQPVPTPTNLVITRPDPQEFTYVFSWEIHDPDVVVDRFRIYALGQGLFPDELIAETTENPESRTFAASASGIRFAVAAVSTENVEGTWTSALAP